MLQGNKGEKILFIFLGLFFLGLFLFIKYRDNRLSTDGRFTVAVVDKYANGKNGQLYSCHYFYENKKYEIGITRFGTRFDTGQLLFVEVSASNPKIYNILDYLETRVPPCIRLSEVPVNGWVKMPIDTCNR